MVSQSSLLTITPYEMPILNFTKMWPMAEYMEHPVRPKLTSIDLLV